MLQYWPSHISNLKYIPFNTTIHAWVKLLQSFTIDQACIVYPWCHNICSKSSVFKDEFLKLRIEQFFLMPVKVPGYPTKMAAILLTLVFPQYCTSHLCGEIFLAQCIYRVGSLCNARWSATLCTAFISFGASDTFTLVTHHVYSFHHLRCI